VASFSELAFDTSAFSSLAFFFDGESPEPPVVESNAGGWALYFRYEQERDRRRRRKRELEEAEDAVEKLPDPVSKEIGLLLQKQEREDERRKELERLRSLVEQFPRTSLPPKAQKAVERVRERQSLSSLINLEKELRRMAEDEEYAVLMLLIND
jgi:hypothetical protein